MGEKVSSLLSSEEVVSGINGSDPAVQLKCIKHVRFILSMKNPDITGIIKLNVLPRILELMVSREDTKSQMECAWIVTNLASGYKDGTDEILRLKGTNDLKKLLDKTNDVHVKNQCFWAFANIACENAKCRDLVLSMGVFQDLIDFIDYAEQQKEVNILKVCIWSLANFFLTKFPPPNDHICRTALKIFIKFFRYENKEIHTEAIYGINNIIDKSGYVDTLIESGLLKDIKKELENECGDPKIKSYLISMVGNVAYGNDVQTQHLIDEGFLPIFLKHLDSGNRNMIKEVLWIFSNIAAGPKIQGRALMEANIFEKVVTYLDDYSFKIRREATWIINNATQTQSHEIVVHLVKLEILKHLTVLLDDSNDEIVKASCDAIFNILAVGKNYFHKVNLFAILVEKYGALKKLEMLQIHPSWDIINKVITILETFYKRHVKEVPKI